MYNVQSCPPIPSTVTPLSIDMVSGRDNDETTPKKKKIPKKKKLPINPPETATAAKAPLRVYSLDPTCQIGGPWENSTQVSALLLALSLCCHPSLSADMVSLFASGHTPSLSVTTTFVAVIRSKDLKTSRSVLMLIL